MSASIEWIGKNVLRWPQADWRKIQYDVADKGYGYSDLRNQIILLAKLK